MNDQLQKPILIIDAMNLFVRSYAAYPQMSTHGYQMGGCIGFLKTLRRLTNEMSPGSIYIAWEGGGSRKRRSLYSEYKLGRQPERMNRFYADDIPDSDENKKHQIIQLLSMLKCVPVCQLYVSDCEGDDVIAYLSRQLFKSSKKVIASSDKDMYQLLDENTLIYSLHKKAYVTSENVLHDFRVQPKNFALAKALCGDPGDNIPGIKGFGFKTAARVLPFLSLEDDILLEDLISYCEAHADESALYKRVVENKDVLKRNWKLVYLDGSMLSHSQSSKIDHSVNTFEPIVNRMGLIKNLIKEGINDFNTEEFFYAFSCINNLNRTQKINV